jgi:release factor glutamine methyltransferase
LAETALALAHKAAQLFVERGFENPRLEAELLLSAVLGVKRLELYTQFDRPVRAEELEQFRSHVRRRLKHEPLQYIVGDVQFRNLRLRVDARALIPRPETEVLVGVVLDHLRGRDAAALRALDIGTGTGAIALALATEGEIGSVVATDVSSEALALAEENARLVGAADRVAFRYGDLWAAIGADDRFDAIVSNPPYVDAADASTLAPEVRDWEPAHSLYAAEGGQAVIARLIAGAAAHLRAGGIFALEVGLGQAERVSEWIAATAAFEPARVTADLTGRPRVVSAIVRDGSASASGSEGGDGSGSGSGGGGGTEAGHTSS